MINVQLSFELGRQLAFQGVRGRLQIIGSVKRRIQVISRLCTNFLNSSFGLGLSLGVFATTATYVCIDVEFVSSIIYLLTIMREQ